MPVLDEPQAASVAKDSWGPAALDARRARSRAHLAALADKRDEWVKRNPYYYGLLGRLLRFLVEPDKRVLSVRCTTGALLSETRPRVGKGVDICPEIIAVAQAHHPEFSYAVAFPDTDEF